MVMFDKGLIASMNAKILGDGEQVVVLGHSYGANHTIWDKIVPSLAEKYRVVLFDWKVPKIPSASKEPWKDEKEEVVAAVAEEEVVAVEEIEEKEDDDPFEAMIKYATYHGFAEDLVYLMDEIGLGSATSVVFVGHSMSGMIGCIASIQRPHLFKKLILIGASPRYLNSEGYEGGMKREAVDQLLQEIESNFHGWASAFAPIAVGGKDVEAAAKFETTLKNMNPIAALSLAKTIFLGDWRDILEEVTTPCTIIQTTNDIVVPTSVGYYMQEKMVKAKAEVVDLDTDGHFPQLTFHEQLLDVLVKALD
ncbi:putative esterase KAI2 [Drosera capensis]